ncbi:DUF1700 domain-containing protein [Actinokineospora spheciospongiae]|uniref:DUF1700 domain-containing protein n=1 Tax=Actinokineospora spheciospongiae TaxID=909613 RepID=UPI000D70A637|nr:hypothetical protein [Actinokineospora spheciospongiae]PWW54285.1 hypothetical protein DFQ13_114161 [Actinokineospora spheciospongiae]
MNGEIDTRPGLEDYLTEVRSALSDLPADEVAEIMEDVEPNVYEVYGETGSLPALTARLGTPQSYADELRAAGDYPPPPAPAPRGTGRAFLARYVLWITGLTLVVALITGIAVENRYEPERFAVLFVVVLALLPALWLLHSRRVGRADVEALAEYQAARRAGRSAVEAVPAHITAYLRGLQPAWWLVRIVLLAVALVAALMIRSGGFVLLGVVVAILLWAGPRVRHDRRWLPVVLAANAFTVGVAIALALSVFSDAEASSNPYRYGYAGYSASGLTYDGSSVANLYAVDAQGKPIPVFYLYDQDGTPLRSYSSTCNSQGGLHSEDMTNRYPQPEVDYGQYGCVESTTMPFVPLPPVAAPSPTPTAPTGPTTPSVSPAPTLPPSAAPTTTPPPATTTPSAPAAQPPTPPTTG